MENADYEIAQLREQVSQLQDDNRELDAENTRLYPDENRRSDKADTSAPSFKKEVCRIVLRFITALFRVMEGKKAGKAGRKIKMGGEGRPRKELSCRVDNEEEPIPEPEPDNLICIVCVSREAIAEQEKNSSGRSRFSIVNTGYRASNTWQSRRHPVSPDEGC
ncbi:hypothetical protein CKM354_000488800 [Cercospora kikuchii]|uniref:Uncharacterized protein n=1 Tax=Cercospora kikuchii TaxID=84275 RepID=A0A9P3CC93_9PEZI|nr:uncharacterized protein CKM354_000488800 [Cercospora kikuchii]GIZ41589.1 hypothetical protein CKM354_000488800 [Cercospora kikuchii]